MSFCLRLVDGDEGQRLTRNFPGFSDGFVRCDPCNLLMPAGFIKRHVSYKKFQVRSDDTWVVSFPKSGTTWTQEMVWLLANDCDFEKAKQLLRVRFPFLEDSCLIPEAAWSNFQKEMADGNHALSGDVSFQDDFIDSLQSPRFLKSHLPLSYLPNDLLDRSKVIYVARNPKDVVVSWYYHHMLDPIMETPLSFDEFVESFISDQVIYSSYWDNVFEAWNKRHDGKLLFIFYEDLKKDLPGQIKNVANFLGKTISDEQLAAMAHHLSFEQFKANPWVNAAELQTIGYFKKEGSFIRKGKSGDWKNHFSQQLSGRFDRWIEQHLEGSDLKFPCFSN